MSRRKAIPVPGVSALFAAMPSDPKSRRQILVDYHREKARQLFWEISKDPELGEAEAHQIFAFYAKPMSSREKSRFNDWVICNLYDGWVQHEFGTQTAFINWLAKSENKSLFAYGPHPTITKIRQALKPSVRNK